MWKIFFVYSDKSKCTITNKSSDITLSQAIKYHNQYGVHASTSTYQKYPKAKNESRKLYDIIAEMQGNNEDDESRFMLEEDSICYGCQYYKHVNDTNAPDEFNDDDDIDENGGVCDVSELCVGGSMNGYRMED
jgi:hypothetical protein